MAAGRRNADTAAMRIRRDDLYTRIWSQPATKLAREFDVSSSYLARVCEGLNVPHPPRGYWARKAAGETIPVPPLPPAGPGDPVEWIKGVAVPERLIPLEPEPPAKPARKGERPRPSRHALVVAWKDFLEEATPNELGYLLPRKKNLLDAFVTKATLRTAVDALNALFVELEMRGHKVQLLSDYGYMRPAIDVALREISDRYERASNRWQPGRSTVVYIGETAIGLALFELTEHMRVRRTGSDRYVRLRDLKPMRRYAPQSPDEEDLTRDVPSGRLILRAYVPASDTPWRQDWSEAKSGDLIAMTAVIADALEQAAPTVRQQVEEAERRDARRRAEAEEQWNRHKAQERARKREQARDEARKDLHSIVDAWAAASALEGLIAEVTRDADTLDAGAREALEARIREARGLIGGQNAAESFRRWTMPGIAAAEEPDEAN